MSKSKGVLVKLASLCALGFHSPYGAIEDLSSDNSSAFFNSKSNRTKPKKRKFKRGKK